MKTFENIASLKLATLKEGQFVETGGYYSKGDGGGARYLIATPQAADEYGDHTLANGNVAVLQSIDANILQYGGVGDGIADDTLPIEAWFEKGLVKKLVGANKTFLYKGNGLVTSVPLTGSFVFHGNGMEIDCQPISNQYYAILLTPADASAFDKIEFRDLTISGNGLFAYGIRIDGSVAGDNFVNRVVVNGVTVDGLDNAILPTVSSTSGVACLTKASNVSIENCFTTNISRTQVNPGSANSSGILVSNATSVVSIKDNNIRGILSPSGDDDADGIVVFADSDRLVTPAIAQSSRTVISGNKLSQTKGRGIKLQVANSIIRDNYFEIDNIELITNFHFVDTQIGGCDVHNNYFRMISYTGGASASVVAIRARENGGQEGIYNIKDNTLHVDQNMAYAFQATVDANSYSTINIKGNSAHGADILGRTSTGLQLGLDPNANRCFIDLSSNNLALGGGQLIDGTGQTRIDWADATSGPLISAYLTLRCTSNSNALPSSDTDIINSGLVVPYLQDVVFADNKIERSDINAKGFDILLAPEGNRFYYNTDGGAGGIINAPSGYNRNVYVESASRYERKLTYITGGEFVVTSSSIGTWYEYNGTALP